MLRTLGATTCERRIVVSCFCLIAILGLLGVECYGITEDEEVQRAYGEAVYGYVLYGYPALLSNPERYHGSAVELPLYAAERVLRLENARDIYLLRHVLTFLVFFVGSVFFFLLVSRHFESSRFGLLGLAFLVLSPRVFGDSFYNSKDIPFLSLFIISVYSLVRYIDQKTILRAALHALACALLIDVRILGVLVPSFTLLFLTYDAWKNQIERKQAVLTLGCYLLLLVVATIVFWPTLWHRPVANFLAAFQEMQHFPWHGEVFYLGSTVKAANLRWHYIPVWIGISTPLLYLALFVIGVAFVSVNAFRQPRFSPVNCRRLLFAMWFGVPVFSVMFFHSVVYDGWRHLYFIYPALLLFSLEGLVAIWRWTGWSIISTRNLRIALPIALSISLLSIASFQLRYYAFQQTYFNPIGRLLGNAFERDYWGSSYRQAYEYVLAHSHCSRIKVAVANDAGRLNLKILRREQRERIVLVNRPDDATYFLTNYRSAYQTPIAYPEVKSFVTSGQKIMGVYAVSGYPDRADCKPLTENFTGKSIGGQQH